MLSFIRTINQKGLLILVTVAICVAFGWFFTKADTTTGQHVPTIVVGDSKLKQASYQRISSQSAIAGHLNLPGSAVIQRLFVPTVGQYAGEALTENGVYPATIQLVRDEAKRLGIAISDEEVTEVLHNTPAFLTNGQFDQSKFLAYEGGDPSNPSDGITIMQMTQFGPRPSERPISLSRFGLTAADIKQVVRDYLSAEKILETVGAGIQAPDWRAVEAYEQYNQIITADVLSFTREELEGAVDTSDEAIAAYYEENKDRFMTQPRLVVQYAVFDHTQKPIGKDETADQIAERLASASQDKVKMRRKADELYEAIRTGSSFEEAAELHEVTPTISEPFEAINAPAALRDAQRELFEVQSKDTPVMIVNAPNSSLVILVKDFIAAEPKPLDSVRDEVKQALLQSNSADLAREAADTAHEKLTAAKTEGTATLADLKTAAGIETGTVAVARKLANAPGTTSADRNLRGQLESLNVGDLSAVIPTADGFDIALITKREIERSETRDEEITSIDASFTDQAAMGALGFWWKQAVLNANPRLD